MERSRDRVGELKQCRAEPPIRGNAQMTSPEISNLKRSQDTRQRVQVNVPRVPSTLINRGHLQMDLPKLALEGPVKVLR